LGDLAKLSFDVALRSSGLSRRGIRLNGHFCSAQNNLYVEHKKTILEPVLRSTWIGHVVMNMVVPQDRTLLRSNIRNVYYVIRYILDDPIVVLRPKVSSVLRELTSDWPKLDPLKKVLL